MAAKPEVIEAEAKLAQYRIDRAANKGTMLLTNLESQRSYIAYLHFFKSPCWSCAEPVNYYEAVGEDYSPTNYRGDKEPYTCPHCGVEMHHVVPFFPGPAPWYWGNPKIFRKKEEKEETK
jgi:hypothetical protein